MKKLLLSAIVISLFAFTATASIPSTNDNPVKENFQKEFAGSNNVTWTSDENFNYASFEKNGGHYSAVYSKESGNLVGTATLMEAVDLSSPVKTLLAKKFSNHQITGKAIEIDYNGYMAYVVSVENDKEILTVRVEGKRASVTGRLKKL